MGWTYCRLNGRTTEDMLREFYEWSGASGRGEIVAYSIKGNVAYLAVKRTLPATGESYTWAGIALLDRKRGQDGYDFGIKEMDETVGPSQTECPRKILDLLSPLEEIARLAGTSFQPDSYAAQWRAACRKNLAKKAEGEG